MKDLAPFRRWIRRLLARPVVKLGMGLALIASSGSEVLAPWLDGSLDRDLGAEHGVLLFGLTHLVKSVLELFEAADNVREAVQEPVDGAVGTQAD